MANDYVQDTRGVLTASKLKTFKKSPYLYKVKYVDEQRIETGSEKAYLVGTGFHELMHKGKEFFLEKYEIGDGFFKADLSEKIVERDFANMEDIDKEALKKKMIKDSKNYSLPKLRETRYGSINRASMQKKIQLTPAEGRNLLGMYASCLKQPILDIGSKDYICEERLEATYEGKKLGAKPDRFKIRNKDNKFYSLEELNEIFDPIEDVKDRIEKAKELGLQALIRDRKSCGDIGRVHKEMFEFGDDIYEYGISMAFYFTIIFVRYGVEADVYLDYVEKSAPYFMETMAFDRDTLKSYLKNDIKFLILGIKASEVDGKRALPDRIDMLEDKELRQYSDYIPVFQETPVFIQ